MSIVRIATRKSALAMWQARHVQGLVSSANPGLKVELVPIVTRGDRILDRPLAEIGGKGLFLKELEQALLEDRADFAVHSMKDVPPEMPPGLILEVMLERANPQDAWLCPGGHQLENLPPGSRVGTSSLRRQCLLLMQRPDLVVVPLRGNVDTRLRKLDEGQYDAIILAAAGLERLGLAQRIDQLLVPPEWLPAATQGIIGIQCREDDNAIRRLLAPLADRDTIVQAQAERSAARLLQGSCQVPLAVFAELGTDKLMVRAMIGLPDGSKILRASGQGSPDQASEVGAEVARLLLDQGAQDIIASLQ
jgi:hydroxymethylbilane synthase